MSTIKLCTDISQSKKLAEILPLESADMMYHSVENEYGSGAFVVTSKVITNGFKNDNFYIDDIPCWSLAALINMLPKRFRLLKRNKITYYAKIGVLGNSKTTKFYDNPIDACYEMIIKLNELKML